jgi:hypothetical protein
MKIREGFKYVLDEEAQFKLPEWFPRQYRTLYEDVRIKVDSENLTLKQGFAWNGANAFPDHDWIIVPSAIHDAMLWWRHYYWADKPKEEFEGLRDREMKRCIDRWFADECKSRIPSWRRFTPSFLFFGVNVLSKLSLGPDQAEAHKIKEYV